MELEIRLAELEDSWHYTSLEKIFFEEKYTVYLRRMQKLGRATGTIEVELKKYETRLKREVTHEDVLKLVEKPVRKISMFDVKQLEDAISKIEAEIKRLNTILSILHNIQSSIFST
jgi:topoisomerase IV subunit A